MKRVIKLIAFVAILFSIQSCVVINEGKIGLTAFNDTLITKYKLTEENKMAGLQFFNGPSNQSIILKRTYTEKETTIVDGVLRDSVFTKTEKITINPFTKGRFVNYAQKKISISFDDEKELYIMFCANKFGNYVIYDYLKNNHIMYKGQEYEIVSAGQLYINLTQLTGVEENEIIAPGVEVK
ncbi:MAG: hypothetical protein WCI41_01105 [bacterium]